MHLKPVNFSIISQYFLISLNYLLLSSPFNNLSLMCIFFAPENNSFDENLGNFFINVHTFGLMCKCIYVLKYIRFEEKLKNMLMNINRDAIEKYLGSNRKKL